MILAAALASCAGGDDPPRPGPVGGGDDPRRAGPVEPAPPGPAAEYPLPAAPGHLAALLREPAVVRERPGGRVAGRLGRRTPFGSPTAVWIRAVRGRGRWVGVVSPATAPGRLGWIDRRRTRLRLYRARASLHADLSAQRLELRVSGRVIRRVPITVGARATPTPTGRFAVTDKLRPTDSPNPYGCCILALSGRQPHLRPGWAGGDRIAIHGSPANRAGGAASAGCLRARDADLRALLGAVVLGTPVVIRA